MSLTLANKKRLVGVVAAGLVIIVLFISYTAWVVFIRHCAGTSALEASAIGHTRAIQQLQEHVYDLERRAE